jgi:HEPN domain-containing protein
VDRKDLQDLSKIRLKEATALLKLGLFDGAYYLAGYSVECAIKACIAKETKRGEFPDKRRVDSSYTHSLKELIRVAGLEYARNERISSDPAFKTNWEAVQAWTEQSRYERNSQKVAELLVGAAADRRHGIISWLKLHW